MALRRLQVSNFRCLRFVELHFDSRYTLISGPNASGKTSLLEAMYVLGRGRSFRTRRLERLIREGSDRFVVFGEIDFGERRLSAGLEGAKGGIRAKLAGDRTASLAELAAILPAQIIDPEVHRLIEDGPAQRRRFLDWGVFHVEHRFLNVWQRYRQVLKQRNAALRARQPRELITVWNPELLALGLDLTAFRERYLESLSGVASAIARRILGMELRLVYRPGWNQELSFEEALSKTAASELDAATTQVGPQRAELAIFLNDHPVKDRISRGQQKLLAAALLIAQLKMFPSDTPIQPTLLLDDPAAELDFEHLAELITEVGSQRAQLVITTLDGKLPAFGSPGCHYHIDDGNFRSVA